MTWAARSFSFADSFEKCENAHKISLLGHMIYLQA
jgi:hypothetical protein